MKHSNDHDPLGPLLREWDVTAEAEAAEPARFEEEVWRRIAAEEAARGSWLTTLLEAWRGRVLNPAWGLAVIVLGLGIGAGFGQRAADQEWSRLGQSYANSINPIALAGQNHDHTALAQLDQPGGPK